jgi:hypothetical protein
MRRSNGNLCNARTVVLALAAALAPAWVSGQEIGPVKSGVLTPAQRAPAAAAATTRIQTAIPFLTSAGDLGYRALKARSQSIRASGADQILSPDINPASADITTSFLGLNRLTAQNHGFIFVPPDPQVAKSSSRVLEATNSALRLFNTTGGVLQTMDLNTFFGAPTGDGLLFDPKTIYDINAARQRFYVTALQLDAGPPQVSRIWLGISRSLNPANLNPANWCIYFLNGIRNGGTANASWADYEAIGTAADALLISDNQFRFSDSTFTFAIVHALRKLVAANNATSCPGIPFFTFQPSATSGNGSIFTLQPVQQLTSPSSFAGTTNPAYLINTIIGTSATYRVTRIRNVGSSPTLQTVNVAGSFIYSVPPTAVQSGSALRLDTGDNRMVEAAGRGDALWGAHTTGCSIGATNVACIRAVRILAGQSGGAPTATISQQRTFGQASSYMFWPGLAVNLNETTVVGFHYVSPSATGGRLSSWWAIKDLTNLAFGSISPVTTGTCAQTTRRTGDYFGAETDHAGRGFWLASERATTFAGLSGCNWQTQIVRIVPGNPVAEGTPVAER